MSSLIDHATSAVDPVGSCIATRSPPGGADLNELPDATTAGNLSAGDTCAEVTGTIGLPRQHSQQSQYGKRHTQTHRTPPYRCYTFVSRSLLDHFKSPADYSALSHFAHGPRRRLGSHETSVQNLNLTAA